MKRMISENLLVDFSNFKDFPIIISPNLGKPQIKSYLKNDIENINKFEIEILIAGLKSHYENYILEFISNNIELKPILGLDHKTRRGVRGESVKGEILEVKEAPIYDLSDERLIINYNLESPRKKPITENIYGNRDKFFIVKVEFPFNNEFKNYLKQRTYLMFDLIQKFTDSNNDDELQRINYHAIVITTQEWKNFTIIHATDLHIAKRNDEILPILLKGFNKSISKSILMIKDFLSGTNKDSIESRFINPNNNLRLFIKLMNILFDKGSVDLIIFTGDLIDFTIRSDIGDKIFSFEMKNTNWNIFYNIILNFPIKLRDDIEPVNIYEGEELLVPFFTTVGNHDYRSYHYDLRWGSLHKVVNVHQLEIMHYKDVIPANPISSLYVNNKTMTAYNQFINPYQDYYIRLGDHLILIMDSGYDSAKEIKDLFMGNPSAVGFSDEQLKYMENVIESKSTSRGVRIALFHAPIINPTPYSAFPFRLKREFKLKGINSLDDFKEDALKKFDGEDGRSDYYIDYKFGTISNNWDKTLKLFQENNFLVLNGHTHKFFEFRTESTDEPTELIRTQHFVLKKEIKVPVAIYMDDYSLKYKDPDFFNFKLPFYLQTPSLGVGRFNNTNLTGAFRIIKIKNNKIESFRIDFLSNYQNLFVI